MKNLIICMLLGFSLNSAIGQIPVTDAALASYLQTSDQIKSGEDKTRFAQTIAEIKTQVQFMKDHADKFKEISKQIDGGMQMIRIAKRQGELSQEIIDGITLSANTGFSMETKDHVINLLLQEQSVIRQYFSEVKKVVTPGALKMNDAERIAYLNQLETDINQNLRKIRKYNHSINRMNKIYEQYNRVLN